MLCGWVGALLITIVIVGIVELISKTKLPYGWIGNIVAGFIGGVLGQFVLGQWGPNLFGVYLIQTFIGSLVLILLAKWIIGMMAKSRQQ